MNKLEDLEIEVENLKSQLADQKSQNDNLRSALQQMIHHKVWPFTDKFLTERLFQEVGYLLKEEQIQKILGVDLKILRKWRKEKKGPPWIILEDNIYLYPYMGLINFFEKRLIDKSFLSDPL